MNRIDTHDLKPPKKLQTTQEWFASVITNKLGTNNTIQPRLGETDLTKMAAEYIAPSLTLNPLQRIQIYNQQYWWRLLNLLQINFPLVTRLFGRQAFNETIGVPYLFQNPPNHWSLNVLGERLPNWILKNYRQHNKSLVYQSSYLDWKFGESFICPAHPPLDLTQFGQENPEHLLSYPLFLQPHVNVFKWDFHLFNFRHQLLKEDANYWISHPYPKLSKGSPSYFVLYRTADNLLAWRQMSQGEFILLEQFKIGSSISSACEYIETQKKSIYEFIAENLQTWIQSWAQAGWLTLKK